MKPERNCDKIKRLERELRTCEERRKAAGQEVRRLHRELERTRQAYAGAARETQTAADLILGAAALSRGARVGAGAWELRISAQAARGIRQGYRVLARKDGEHYIIRVEEVEP